MLGLFQGRRLVRDWRVRTLRDGTADEYGVLVRGLCREVLGPDLPLEGVVVASVVPPLDAVLRSMARDLAGVEPYLVTAESVPGLRVRYREPGDVGADRVVNALAALEEHAPPVIVVDFGTAVTFDVIGPEGDYLGGAIAPGLGVSLNALYRSAARLRPVDLELPPSPVGRTTPESIGSGVLYGYASLVEGMVERIQEVLPARARVVATGGEASLLARACRCFDAVDPRLTLKGLCLAYLRRRAAAP